MGVKLSRAGSECAVYPYSPALDLQSRGTQLECRKCTLHHLDDSVQMRAGQAVGRHWAMDPFFRQRWSKDVISIERSLSDLKP
jgi:hypothetical protein